MTEATTRAPSDFEAWLAAVDRAVERRAFISVFDLADQPFRDDYDDGLSPTEAAELALEAEGWDG